LNPFLKNFAELLEGQLVLFLEVESSEEGLSEMCWKAVAIDLQEPVETPLIDCIARASMVTQLFKHLLLVHLGRTSCQTKLA